MSLLSAAKQKTQKEKSIADVTNVSTKEPTLKRLNVNIPDDLMLKLKIKVARERTTMNKVINDFLLEYVKD